jgi:dsRNA-specific ribonuclease
MPRIWSQRVSGQVDWVFQLVLSCSFFYLHRCSAKLTLDDAVSHLYHFCATLPSSQYVDLRPVFTYSGGPTDGKTKNIRAKVLLPNSVDVSVREACSSSQWLTEKFAKRDASFEAYVALFNAGLVNENLLPLRYDEEIAEASSAMDKRPSLASVDKQMSFWSDLIACKWETMPELHNSHITVYREGTVIMRMLMILPQALPPKTYLELGCDHGVSFTAKIESADSQDYCPQRLGYYVRTTELLFGSVYRPRLSQGKNDFVCLFVPANTEDLHDWLETSSGASPARAVSYDNVNGLQIGLIRNLAKSRAPYIFDGIENYPTDTQTSNHITAVHSDNQHIKDEQYLRCIRLTQRGDFVRKGSSQPHGRAPDTRTELLPISRCEVDNLPSVFSWFALLVPFIMHQLDIQALAESLRSNLLPSLGIKDLRLIIAATSTPAAQEQDNYQRLEFIGDSILKLFTSVTLMAQHLHWHEGILSGKKDHVVSNGRLSVAACQAGLAKYIRCAQFTVKKWRPPYISDLLRNNTQAIRELSTKTLADVVEALIGAAYVDGGEETVLACLAVFLPEISWTPLPQLYQTLCSSYDVDILMPPNFVHVEQLISHTFRHKLLLVEALTHPSHQGPNSTASYQRLEFLGDSILDNIVVFGAYGHQPPLPTPSLHLIRTVLVNASFLAFLCLTLSAPDDRAEIVRESDTRFSTVQTTISLHLWQFMRHTNIGVRTSQQACLANYKLLRGPIIEALRQGNEYPWVLLAQLDAPKYFSDIIESLLGAIYIDTSGSLAACEAFLDRLGIMGYLRRIICEDVALLHPKEQLGQLAGTETVTYTRQPDVRDDAGGVGDETKQPGKLTCVVVVGDREIVRVHDGISVLEVETRAAAEAVQILELEGRRLPKRR